MQAVTSFQGSEPAISDLMHLFLWPLGRVWFEATFNLIRHILSFFSIKLASYFFYKLAENWSI